ncbi:DUF551 domain-containing protein [Diplocloster modestus]|uniref:DUF551 domain-containing protein n=1 Tax=Diplocloster modestus TaxID=2850322 RepID=A0ABS6K0P3_9FIRM|nr:DUF551 domain-containing protein [Diplocloster modestus]MBU9724416.1 DUF551 domain-containing protein [Diplocloster modestus]
MGDNMNYPDSAMEFIKGYSFKDGKEIYTNGSELIPVFRVEQMIEHYINARWIPVTERLPEKKETVLVQSWGGAMYTAWYGPKSKKWKSNDCCGECYKVIAWMPLPEPFNSQN